MMSWHRLLLSCVIVSAINCCGIASLRAEESAEDSVAVRAEAELPAEVGQDEVVDPLVFDPDLAIWTLVVFFVLLVVLKRFAWGPILQSLEGREQGIANHIAEAERIHQEAKALLAQYEQKLATAASEVREMMEEARRDAEHARQTILAEAKAGAEAEQARALHDIESATDAALESLSERSAQLAVELAGKILKFKLTSDDHARLVQEALAKFPAAASSAN
jgi:F-type H+-transporting ATPase subunit b